MTTILENDTITQSTPVEETSDFDPNLRTHIINPPANLHIWRPGMTTQDVVVIARATGLEIVALCGYRFVPKHDPEKFDACERCFEIAGELMRGAGE